MQVHSENMALSYIQNTKMSHASLNNTIYKY